MITQNPVTMTNPEYVSPCRNSEKDAPILPQAHTVKPKNNPTSSSPPKDTVQSLSQKMEQKALLGLAQCARGYVVREVKSTYELGSDGHRTLRNEIVTRKRVGPDLAAIQFILTNLNPTAWQLKPAAVTVQPEEEPDLSALSVRALEELAGWIRNDNPHEKQLEHSHEHPDPGTTEKRIVHPSCSAGTPKQNPEIRTEKPAGNRPEAGITLEGAIRKDPGVANASRKCDLRTESSGAARPDPGNDANNPVSGRISRPASNRPSLGNSGRKSPSTESEARPKYDPDPRGRTLRNLPESMPQPYAGSPGTGPTGNVLFRTDDAAFAHPRKLSSNLLSGAGCLRPRANPSSGRHHAATTRKIDRLVLVIARLFAGFESFLANRAGLIQPLFGRTF